MVKKRIKPDFSPGVAKWVDGDFFPPDVKRELLLHLDKSTLTQKQQQALITFADVICQQAFPYDPETGKKQRAQIEAVAMNADRLLASLTLMSGPAASALRAQADYLVYGSGVPVELDDHVKTVMKHRGENLLLLAWDWIEALQTAATFAAEQFNIDKTSKPTQTRARGYVALMAQYVEKLSGSKPPKDPASWFAGFAGCVCKHMQLDVGARIVKSGIQAVR